MESGSRPSVRLGFFCKMLERIEDSANCNAKRSALQRLLEAARRAGDLYGVVRLLIPQRDLERQNYSMKETVLASCMLVALGIAPKSVDGQLLFDWKRAKNTAVGDFASIALQVMAKRQSNSSSDISIPEVNSLLDGIAISNTREEKGSVLRDLISKTTANEMKWVLRIILKDIRIGLGENAILDEIHPDARVMMASCVDLRNVCSHLHNHTIRYLRQELVVGKAVKCQHSKRMCSIEATWEAMKGKGLTAECKFDGDRMQVHKDEACFWFWSRNGKEHDEYKSTLGDLLHRCILSTRCILDGELLVWDHFEKRFKQRTKSLNRHTATASRKGFDTTDQVCYVIFDLLYEEKHGSVIHLSLKERRNILKSIIQPSFPQLFYLGEGNTRWSIVPTLKEELADFFVKTVQQGEEGIVVKDLSSQWCPDNRDGRWCKIKPDYVSMGNDLDLLIIGGYYGRSQYGGQVASYLLALVDESEGNHSPSFISICRCGSGLSEDDRYLLQRKLAPFFLVNKKGGRPPNSCKYLVTNSRYECPDVWISKPEMSVVVQVSSEQRIYPTSTFKAGWTFRFPRIVRVRYDKCWSDSLHLREFKEMIQAARLNGNSLLSSCHKYDPLAIVTNQKRRRRGPSQRCLMVLSHFQSSIFPAVEQAHGHLDDLVFYICNMTEELEKENFFAQIQQSGGTIAMNLSQCVTHVIASEAKGLQFKVAVSSDCDVIHISWLLATMELKELVPILPRHYLHLSTTSKKTIEESVDEFGDPWFDSIETEDLFQIFQNMMKPQCSSAATNLLSKKLRFKLAGLQPWGIFHGCYIYFCKPVHSRNLDSQCIAMISLRRFKLEVEMRGASVSNKLCGNTTHMVVYVADKINLSFKTILYSLSEPERTLAWTPQLCIISHVWIEDCIRFGKRLDSKLYSLRNEKELSKSLEIKCDRPKVEEAPMQSIMANSLNSNNEKPPNEGDSSRECFPEVACKERQMDSSCVRSSQFSKLKGLDKSECSSEPWKDSASDVVENMTQIFLGPPYNSLSLSSSTDIVHNLHTCSSSSKWEETPENHDYLAPKKQKVQVDRSVGLFSQSLSLITDTENFAAVEAGKGPVYVPRRRFTAKDFAHLLD